MGDQVFARKLEARKLEAVLFLMMTSLAKPPCEVGAVGQTCSINPIHLLFAN